MNRSDYWRRLGRVSRRAWSQRQVMWWRHWRSMARWLEAWNCKKVRTIMFQNSKNLVMPETARYTSAKMEILSVNQPNSTLQKCWPWVWINQSKYSLVFHWLILEISFKSERISGNGMYSANGKYKKTEGKWDYTWEGGLNLFDWKSKFGYWSKATERWQKIYRSRSQRKQFYRSQPYLDDTNHMLQLYIKTSIID